MDTKANKTKKYIVEKVANLFNKNGYSGTSLQLILAETGLSKGSIYGNFKDKETLAIEVFRFNFNQLTNSIHADVLKESNAIGKLNAYLNFYKKNYHKIFANGGCAILNTSVESDDNQPALKREVVKAINSWKDFLVEILIEGIKKGQVKCSDPEFFASNMMAIIEGAILLAKTTGQYKYLKYNFIDLENKIKLLEKI